MKTEKKTKWQLFRKQGALQVFVWMGMIYLIIFNLFYYIYPKSPPDHNPAEGI